LCELDDAYMNSGYHAMKMWKRLRYSIVALAIESSMFYVRTNDLDRALYCDRLLAQLNPKQPYWYFKLAQSYARKDDLRNTIQYLEQAIELGFRNVNNIKNAKEFIKFEGKKKFIKFINSLDN